MGGEPQYFAKEHVTCEVWGVLNVTPDSFSDGGRFLDPYAALRHAEHMVAQGAAVIDVGGESTRPASAAYGDGSQPVTAEEELQRVVPVIERLAQNLAAKISVDTTKAEVAKAALDAGAHIVNDVSGGASSALLDEVAKRGAELVLMHNRRRGQVDDENTRYADVTQDVRRELGLALLRARRAGVDRVWIDPGIGFAKTAAQSATVLRELQVLVDTGHPVLVGASRKSFLGALAPLPDGSRPGPGARLGASVAAALSAAAAGARAVRVHDVLETWQALRMWEALSGGRRS